MVYQVVQIAHRLVLVPQVSLRGRQHAVVVVRERTKRLSLHCRLQVAFELQGFCLGTSTRTVTGAVGVCLFLPLHVVPILVLDLLLVGCQLLPALLGEVIQSLELHNLLVEVLQVFQYLRGGPGVDVLAVEG